jgi:protein-S-isoprenylcysteine O-methyltransferase Ste14
MSTPKVSSEHKPKQAGIQRRLYPMLGLVGITVGHGLLPWAISLLTARYGWTDGRPGIFNLLGVIPALFGLTGTVWGFAMHYLHAPDRVEWGWASTFFIVTGPYKYSRNPMYTSEILLWLGWAGLYGSAAVLIAAVIFAVYQNFYGIPREERAMAARFGESYRQYQKTVPRWLGIPRR